jgi:hypothetical protein
VIIPNLTAQTLKRHVPPVDHAPPALHIKEMWQRVDHGRLAGAGKSYDAPESMSGERLKKGRKAMEGSAEGI